MSNYKIGGYEKKYHLSKTNGQPLDPAADYFVLRIDKDPHALVALKAYAESVQIDNLQLAQDLWAKIDHYDNRST